MSRSIQIDNQRSQYHYPYMDFAFSKKSALLLSLMMCVIVLGPFFRPGLFSGHDPTIRDHFRIQAFSQGLAECDVLPRWQADFYYGFGFPFFNYYQPLIYYFAALLFLAGLSATGTLKCVLLLGVLFSAVTMFFCAHRFWGVTGAWLSSLCYSYSLYHLADLFVRTSLAEFWSFVFFPLIALCCFDVFQGERKGILLSLVTAFLLLCHNIEAMFFLPMAGAVVLIVTLLTREFRNGLRTLAFMAGGAGLSAFFWVPALFEKEWAQIDRMTDAGYNLFIHFIEPYQLINGQWGFGASGPGVEQFPFSISFAILIPVAMCVWKLRSVKPDKRVWLVCWLAIAILACWMTTESSAVIWNAVSFIQIAQFPWRLLAPVSFVFAFLAGGAVYELNLHHGKLICFVFVLCLIAFHGRFIRGNHYKTIEKEQLSIQSIHESGITTTASSEYLPKWADENRLMTIMQSKHQSQEDDWPGGVPSIDILNGTGLVLDRLDSYNRIDFAFTASSSSLLRIHQLYFPGWEVWVNNEKRAINILPSGLIGIELDPGDYKIQVKFKSTADRIAGMTITGFSMSILLALWGFTRFGKGFVK